MKNIAHWLAAVVLASTLQGCRHQQGPEQDGAKDTCVNARCPSNERLVTRSLNTCLVLDNGSSQCWTKLAERSPIVVQEITGIGPALQVQGDPFSICALSREGRLYCGGEHVGATVKAPFSAPVASLPPTLKVRAFSSHYFTCALLSDDTVRCADPPQQGAALSFLEPLRFDNDPPVTVSAGLMTCVLRLSGSVVCYGDGTAEKFARQRRTIDLGRKRARALSSGERHACAVLEDESIVCWREQVQRLLPTDQVYWSGSASPGNAPVTVALGDVGRIRGISAGDDHTCAWFESGKLKCWGQNDHGQLGLGDLTARGNRPDQMGNHLPFVDLGREADVVSVAAGPTTTCALLRDRRVKCWGYAYTTANAQGQRPTGDAVPEIPLVR